MFWLLFSFSALGLTYLGKEPVRRVYFHEKNYKIFRILLILLLSFVVGFGGLNFTDHPVYEMVYNSSELQSLTFENLFNLGFGVKEIAVEPGFLIICKICQFLHLGTAGFFTFVALLTNVFLVSFFYRFKLPVATILLYISSSYFLQEMNLVRQMLVCAMFLYSLKYVEQKNWIGFCGFVIAGAFIHTAAIFLLFMMPLCFIDINKHSDFFRKFAIVLWVFSLLIAFGLFNIGLEGVISVFTVYNKYMNTQNNMGVTVVFEAAYNLFVAYLLFVRKKQVWDVNTIAFFLGVFFFNVALQLPNIYRFGYYFALAYCSFVPTMLYEEFKGKNAKIAQPLLYATLFYHSYIIFSRIIHPFELLGQQWYSWSEFFL